MIAFSDWLWRPWQSPEEYQGIDLGNGQTLPAEDVLEGHFRRVASRQTSVPTKPTVSSLDSSSVSSSSVTTVTVQVEDNLKSAITVLAPELTPLTDIAEEVAEAVSYVQPTPVFRLQLQQALERTHREHAVQRALGTRSEVVESSWWFTASMVSFATIIVTVTAVYFWRRQHIQINGYSN